MDVEVKKTIEFTTSEIAQVYQLFERVFKKKRDITTFTEEYCNTPLGYSYHSLLKDNGVIVGFHSCMPFYYKKGTEKFLVALGIDSMVDKAYRDFFNFKSMIVACENRLKENGFKLRIGFPNDFSYPVLTKGLKHKTIGHLRTYALVRNVSSINHRLRFFDPLSRLFSKLQTLISLLSVNKSNLPGFLFHKDRDSFDPVRYKWFGANYEIIKEADFGFVYKIMDYNGSNTVFLMDVYPLTKINFEKAVRYIYKKDRKRIDLILYVGYLHFIPLSLISIPRKYEPKHFNFTCNIFDINFFDDRILDIKNWDVNLSNFDLL